MIVHQGISEKAEIKFSFVSFEQSQVSIFMGAGREDRFMIIASLSYVIHCSIEFYPFSFQFHTSEKIISSRQQLFNKNVPKVTCPRSRNPVFKSLFSLREMC